MTISRAQMNRQLYQMGGMGQMGIGSLSPMQPAMQPAMQSAMYTPLENTYYSGMPMMAGGGRMGYQGGGSPEEEMEDIKQFYYGRRRGEQEDLLDEYQRFKMRKDFLRRYPRDEAKFGGRMGYPKTGIGSLANRQGYFFGGIGDIVGDVFGGIGDVAGDVFGSVGDVVGGVGDVLGDVVGSDIFQKAIPYALAYFSGNPAFAASGEGASFLPSFLQAGGTEGGLGSFGDILGNIGSFMPQGETSGFNPYQFASNLIQMPEKSNQFMEGKGIPTDVEIIVNILSKLLTPQAIAGTGASTISKLTYDEIKKLNEDLKKRYEENRAGVASKKTQYRTAEGRETLPGYNVTGVPRTVADVYRRPVMKGGIMNVPMGKPRTNSVGVKEIDYRKTGGFVPPIGVKEKADDIPAMLSNNEFVFTADAVRAAGGGSVNKGAQKMYQLMNQLEGKA